MSQTRDRTNRTFQCNWLAHARVLRGNGGEMWDRHTMYCVRLLRQTRKAWIGAGANRIEIHVLETNCLLQDGAILLVTHVQVHTKPGLMEGEKKQTYRLFALFQPTMHRARTTVR